MFKIISEIDIAADVLQFDAHGLNCFVQPKYLATKAFGPINRELFYAYHNVYAHYALLGPMVDIYNPDINEPVDLMQHVLSKIGLELEFVDIRDDLVERLHEAIDHGWPAFVPIDRAKCFYDPEAYGRSAAVSTLLIKGYHPQTGAFVVFDRMQNLGLLESKLLAPMEAVPPKQAHRFYTGGYTFAPDNPKAIELKQAIGSVYSDFYLTPALLAEFNASYNKHFTYLKGQIQIMRPKGAPLVRTAMEALFDIADELGSAFDRLPDLLSPKRTVLEQPGTFQTEANMSSKMQILNSQLILGRMLTRLLPEIPERAQSGAALEDAGWAAWSAWRNYIVMVAVMDLQGSRNADVLGKMSNDILAAESKFVKLITSTIDRCRALAPVLQAA